MHILSIGQGKDETLDFEVVRKDEHSLDDLEVFAINKQIYYEQ